MDVPRPPVEVFRAIADETRRTLLDRLAAEGELGVTALAEPLDMSLPAVSQHLKVLREAGLVVERRDGRQRIYRIEAGPIRGVAEWVNGYEKFWNTKLDALGRFLDAKEHKR